MPKIGSSKESFLPTAKTDGKKQSVYLPFWVHSADIAVTMKNLLQQWFPAHIFQAVFLLKEDLNSLACFLTWVQVTPLFQSKILLYAGSVRR